MSDLNIKAKWNFQWVPKIPNRKGKVEICFSPSDQYFMNISLKFSNCMLMPCEFEQIWLLSSDIITKRE